MKPSTYQQPKLKKQATDEFIGNLKRACHWLDIEDGRTRTYVRLLQEFDHVPLRTREHILAYYESSDIVELFELWENRIHLLPELKAKLQTACRKGPIVTEDEKPSTSSNKPRNDLFVYVMAGKFLAAGISLSTVDGICASPGIPPSTADFSFVWNTLPLNVECKRINSWAQLPRRAKDARDQILRTGRSGIIAIDCSVIARPPDKLLETDSPLQSERETSQWLEHSVARQLETVLSPQIVGLILFAGIPAMTATGIVDHSGQDIRRRDRISSILAVGNRSCTDRTILQDIAQRLRKQSLASP